MNSNLGTPKIYWKRPLHCEFGRGAYHMFYFNFLLSYFLGNIGRPSTNYNYFNRKGKERTEIEKGHNKAIIPIKASKSRNTFPEKPFNSNALV